MRAPHFTLPATDGSQYELEQDLGKVIVLTFFTSWCPDCSRDLPKKEHFYQSLNRNEVKMMTINVTGRERNAEEGIAFANKFLSQPTLIDRGREIYDLYGCTGVPTTVVINQQGMIEATFGDKADVMEVMKTIGTLL
ncbi:MULTISPECIES: TlpA disulfide reductase family protein [Pontibacillus]|uniref:TlpA disulfide reductase family protein n=1 Tax=Pontibacillus chungwhensis TaxID=265426 RepID=A0ABY8UYH7_9BACI|nr:MULTISPECIES: TlpA disulfide reductase family protein [Pontibacillus]MCD5325186.1 TlpA family protein disulfide reductase [Pontibacillus sp. HN14]WIF97434.1 TlpA disulfide reductase family protein [Pontibacillus chungwhensis]